MDFAAVLGEIQISVYVHLLIKIDVQGIVLIGNKSSQIVLSYLTYY
jgi:hypothetical protein